jgi:glucose/mannose transport system substrate-binding protein
MYGTRRWLLGAWLCASAAAAQAGPRAEVIHWWTSGGESAAVKQVEQAYRAAGGTWVDTAVAGSEQARAVAINRIAGGNPPTAAQFNTSKQFLDIIEEDMLSPVDDIARRDHWDAVLPAPIVDVIKVRGHWYAVPINIHMQTWIWYSKAAFAQAGIAREPASMDELFADLDKLKAAGVIPLAHGGQAWQEATIFDSAVMSAGGPKFYQQALVKLDPSALGSKTMEKAFDQMRALRGMVDPNFPGRDWNLATSMVISGKAAMQIMGDWAKGEFASAGKQPNVDYLCFNYPGTDGDFIFNTDQFAGFKKGDASLPGEYAFASTIMDKGVQAKFNQIKGSIPARLDVPQDGFDDCGKKSMNDMRAALKTDSMVGSFAHGHAMPDGPKNAVYDVVTHFFNSNQSSADAVKALVAAVKNSQ